MSVCVDGYGYGYIEVAVHCIEQIDPERVSVINFSLTLERKRMSGSEPVDVIFNGCPGAEK